MTTHYNYSLDLSFEVEGPWKKYEDIPKEILRDAALKKVETILDDKDGEAFSLCGVHEVML
jgi:hypothetical protein